MGWCRAQLSPWAAEGSAAPLGHLFCSSSVGTNISMHLFMQIKVRISSPAHPGYGNRLLGFLLQVLSPCLIFPSLFSPCLLFCRRNNSSSFTLLSKFHFQDFYFSLDALQSDNMFLYECHPKHAFKKDKEKTHPVGEIQLEFQNTVFSKAQLAGTDYGEKVCMSLRVC